MNLKNARHGADPRPLDEACGCAACTNHSRAYLHHLVRCGEILASMLLTQHNLRYYGDLMKGLRNAIATRTLDDFTAEFDEQRRLGDIPPL